MAALHDHLLRLDQWPDAVDGRRRVAQGRAELGADGVLIARLERAEGVDDDALGLAEGALLQLREVLTESCYGDEVET